MLKKILFSKNLIGIILLFVIIISSLSSTIFAISNSVIDTSKKASLTIIEYENAHGQEKNSTQNIPLSGVEITIYKVNDKNYDKTAKQIEDEIDNETITLESKTLTTGDDGTVKFSNLELGRYLVVESDSPINVSVKMESFLIDLPRTSDDGTTWNYNVTVYPKNTTVYGDVLLTKYNSDNTITLQGTTWELQKEDPNKQWQKYNYDGLLTTDKNGQISINNLPVGKYRLVEISTLEGYILDSSNTKEFTISSDSTSYKFNVINEKLNIKKQLKTSSGYGKALGAYETDTVEWKITADVPKIIKKMNTYYITDTLPTELDYVSDSIVIYGISENTQKPLIFGTDYTLTQDGKNLKIDFISTKLDSYNSVSLTYKTLFNSSVIYGKALQNSATLTYTNNIDINGNCISTYTTDASTAEVHTGSIIILKTDYDNNPLSGATFKISTSKENAKKGIYLKDKNGNDLTSTSDENGFVFFYGLKYGDDNIIAQNASSSYFVTEIESPTYEENGKIKHYNLLSDPVEVIVDSKSHEYSESTVQIINKKGFMLPITGATGTIAVILCGTVLIYISIKRKHKNDKKQINQN